MENEKIPYKGYTIVIVNDEDAENPIKGMQDNLATFSCLHKRYDLSSDDNKFKDPEDLLDYFKENKGKILAIPLQLYDHSGITISASKEYPYNDQWDSMQVGYAHIHYDKIKKEYRVKKVTKKILEKVKKCILAEIQQFDDYLTGNVYGYEVRDSKGNFLDSCFGFYGYNHKESGLLEYAEGFIDSLIKEEKEQQKTSFKELVQETILNFGNAEVVM